MLAQPRGFCAGVEKAIKALAWMVRVFEPPVYCYHEIVHNRHVVERFRDQGVIFVDDVAEVPPGAPLMLSAHGSAPAVVDAARASRRRRRRRRLPARDQGPPRAEGAQPQGLHRPLRRPRRPRGGGGHHGRGARVGPPARARRGPRRARRRRGRGHPVALLAQTTLSHDEWRGLMEAARRRFPDLVDAQPQRSLLRHDQPPGRPQGDRGRSPTPSSSSVRPTPRTPSPSRRSPRPAAARGSSGSTRPTSCPTTSPGTVGVTAGASAPEALVDDVIARLAPAHGVTEVTVTTEDEYFPPPPELRELLRAVGSTLALLAGRPLPARADPAADDRAVSAAAVLDLLAS